MMRTIAKASAASRTIGRHLLTAGVTAFLLLTGARAGVAQYVPFSGFPGHGSGYTFMNLSDFSVAVSGGAFTGSEGGSVSFSGFWTGSVSMWGIQGTTVPSAGHRDHFGLYVNLRHTPNGPDHPIQGEPFSLSIEYPYEYFWHLGDHFTQIIHGESRDNVYYRFSLTDVPDPIHVVHYQLEVSVFHDGVVSLAAPEPGSLVLAGLGFGIAGIVLRRRAGNRSI